MPQGEDQPRLYYDARSTNHQDNQTCFRIYLFRRQVGTAVLPDTEYPFYSSLTTRMDYAGDILVPSNHTGNPSTTVKTLLKRSAAV